MYRRRFVKNSLAIAAGLSSASFLPVWAQSGNRNSVYANTVLSGVEYELEISAVNREVAGQVCKQVLVNQQLPAPLLRWREGDEISLSVKNSLSVDSSIHWHGILLPYTMDGVPGLSFPGISAGSNYEYRFPLKQSGTYWYHSHSGLQEQQGLYGPIIIDPYEEETINFDREYVLVLSDWSYQDPHKIYSTLKKMSDSYNFQKRTVGDFFSDVRQQGLGATLRDRSMWGAMRMNPTDLSDVTGATYTYLINGYSAVENWTALFNPGEKVRLRFINASAMTMFNIRIPGLPQTVVQADGLNVMPVETDEFQIGVAETFDVIVRPEQDIAYTIFCENSDRSGYARATLASKEGMSAVVPPIRERPLLTMKDMGMSMTMEEPSSQEMSSMSHMNDSSPEQEIMESHGSNHSEHTMGLEQSELNVMSRSVGMGSREGQMMDMYPHRHPQGPGVTNVSMNPINRLHERPLGLEHESHRVLLYTDLMSVDPNPDSREPQREIELHLTSNMERYMWSFDGVKYSDASGPVELTLGERVRLILVNDTMMTHPIHLHGMFFDVVTGEHPHKPRKHTIVVKPSERLAVDVTADALGDWAFHCHLLYHMHAGMMRVVSVEERK